MTIVYRTAQQTDAEKLAAFYNELLKEDLDVIMNGEAVSVDQEVGFIQAHGGQAGEIVLALDQDKIVGTINVKRSAHLQLRHNASFGMSVKKPYRNKGIGKELITRIEDWCRDHDVKRLELEVLENNRNAIALYEKIGFTREGRRVGKIRVKDGFIDLLEMTKTITS